jgi:hypothetical protein
LKKEKKDQQENNLCEAEQEKERERAVRGREEAEAEGKVSPLELVESCIEL